LHLTLVKPPQTTEKTLGTFNLLVLAEEIKDLANVEIIDATNFSIETAANTTLAHKPDVIGITLMGLNDLNNLCTFITTLRQLGFIGKIIVGGHAASLYPLNILQAKADAVVYGEGELTLRDILQQRDISENIQGIFHLKKQKLIKTAPRPLMNINSLKKPQQPTTINGLYMLETSRGCPHKCAFCGSTQFFKNTWRGMAHKKVTQNIAHLVKNGASVIQITDDNFTANPDRALQICNTLKNTPRPLFFIFSARSDDLISNTKLIPALAQAHFLRANIGVETSDWKTAKTIHKNITLEQHKQAFSSMAKEGIYTVASFIIGLPFETEETRKSMLEFAINYTDSATFIPFQPIPGTELFQGKTKPEECSIKTASELTLEFRRNTRTIKKLIQTSNYTNTRGMFAIASLQKRLNDNILSNHTKKLIEKTINLKQSNKSNNQLIESER
jgi:anaerobic magnesium-protoporphyrin IX monomethyl ester cyclase